MEPNKIEEHMQKVLNEREISPSGTAWDSIMEELDFEVKPQRKGVLWYSIAASILALIAFSFFIFDEKDTVPSSIVVKGESPKYSGEGKENVEIENNDEEIIFVVSSENKVEEKREPVFSNKLEEAKIIAGQLVDRNQMPWQDEKNVLVSLDSVLETKVAGVLEKTKFLNDQDYTVTDSEVDSLLRQAQLEILTDALLVDKNKVDALTLLSEVEGELDQSFREQIFESLKSKFLKVRTAVADRNN